MELMVLLVIVAVVLFVAVIAVYNRLVSLRNRVKNAFSQIDVQLKRRYDLIPNLVETAKGYIKHERETLEAVVAARNAAGTALNAIHAGTTDPQSLKSLVGAETALTGALGRFMAVVESYPDLKANQNMTQLMEELTSTENRISFARQAYNDTAMQYNTGREVFPNNMIAGIFGFQVAPMWEIENAAERQSVKVSF